MQLMHGVHALSGFSSLQRGTLHVILTKEAAAGLEPTGAAKAFVKDAASSVTAFGSFCTSAGTTDTVQVASVVAAEIMATTPRLLMTGEAQPLSQVLRRCRWKQPRHRLPISQDALPSQRHLG